MAFGAVGSGFLDQVADISVTQLYPMRSLRHENGIDYIYVQANAAITQYQACAIDAAASTTGNKVTPTTATSSYVEGVAQVAVTTQYFFWLAIKGVVSCKILTAATVGQLMTSTAVAGVLGAGGATDALVHVTGVALEAGAATNAAKLIKLK